MRLRFRSLVAPPDRTLRGASDPWPLASTAALLVAALLPTAALAQTWNESFTHTQLDGLLGGPGLKVLVAGAGEPADEVARAAEGLRSRLRESGLASLVMDAAALGVVREDGDETIRKKATTLPWERLLIVRVFPGARDAAPTAVITVSERSGPTSRSLVVTRGVIVVPAPPPRTEPPAPPPPPSPVVVEPPPAAPPPPREIRASSTQPNSTAAPLVVFIVVKAYSDLYPGEINLTFTAM